MTTKEKIELMQAYLDGKTLEFRHADKEKYANEKWCKIIQNDTSEPFWDWKTYEYRIRKNPSYRPYKSEEEFVMDCKRHGPYLKRICSKDTYSTYVIGLSVRGSWVSFTKAVDIDGNSGEETTFNRLISEYVWQDGTTCGIKEYFID